MKAAAILLGIFCIFLVLFKTAEKSPVFTENILISKVEPAKEPTEKHVVFDNEDAFAIDAIKSGMVITCPDDIVIEEDMVHGYFLSPDKMYYFSIWMEAKNNRRMVKKGTKLVVRKAIPNEITIMKTPWLLSSPEFGSLFRVSTIGQNQTFYIDIVVSKTPIVLIKYSKYSRYRSDARKLRVSDILKYSDILEIPGVGDAEVIE